MDRGHKADNSTRHSRRPRSFPSFPALPGHPSSAGLQGALAFLEGPASEWTVRALSEWFGQYLVSPGLLKRPQIVLEPGATPVMMDPRVEADGTLEDLVTRARTRVLAALRGLVAPVADDRFLHAAIYGGRVRRTVVNGKPTWIASPREIDFLGDVVLSLLAADILIDRDYYRAHLCLCEVCSRVAYKDAPESRAICPDHRSATSGLTPRVR
jgi:hypothetical protein